MSSLRGPIWWLEQRLDEVPDGDDWLSAAERSQMYRLSFPKRRSDWRMGRWTAKCAVALYLHLSFKCLSEIEIWSTTSGAPEVVLCCRSATPTISISHSNGVSMCVVGPPNSQVGGDIERIEPRTKTFVSTFLSEFEQAELRQVPADFRSTAETLIWSAKESFLKATRQGLTVDTRLVEVDLTRTSLWKNDEQWRSMIIRGCGGEMSGYWMSDGSMIRTVSGTTFPPLALK